MLDPTTGQVLIVSGAIVLVAVAVTGCYLKVWTRWIRIDIGRPRPPRKRG